MSSQCHVHFALFLVQFRNTQREKDVNELKVSPSSDAYDTSYPRVFGPSCTF